MGLSRFMQDLEVRIVDGQNSVFVDLFDEDHARKVLAAFGRAYGRLPEIPSELSPAQQRFLETAVRDLSQDGKVTCVQLALLADMLRSRPWTVATLQSLGGISGVGQLFLEESFGATAPPRNRHHARAARAVLALLLPEAGTDLKGNRRSSQELFDASQYARDSGQFDDLIQLLDQELRLITPAEPPDEPPPTDTSPGHSPSWHLAHDYLVPALREWLTLKQRETREGRALLKLQEHTALWQSRPQPRLLPGVWDFLAIRLLTRSRHWTPPQTRLMREARRRYGRRLLTGMGIALLLVLAAGAISREIRDAAQHRQAEQFVSRLWQVEWEYVPALLEENEHLRQHWEPLLARDAAAEELSPDQRLRKSLALAGETLPDLPAVCRQLLNLPRDALPVLLPSLTRYRHAVSQYLWTQIDATGHSPLEQLSRGAILAAFAAGDRRWPALSPVIVEQLLQTDPLELEGWVRLLQPTAAHLIPDLLVAYDHREPGRRQLAASLLARFGALDRGRLPAARVAELVVTADERQWALVISRVQASGDADSVIPVLESVLNETKPPAKVAPPASQRPDEAALLAWLWRRANAAGALLHLGRPQAFWRSLGQSPEPDLRTALIDAAVALDVPWRDLLNQAESAPQAAVRQAAVLALDGYTAAWSEIEFEEVRGRLQRLFETDVDAGVHAACGWLLARIFPESANWVREPVAPSGEANWFFSPTNHLLVRVPRGESGIEHEFALAACEISRRQFREFQPHFEFAWLISFSDDDPATNISFYDALRYCRWLSEREGIPPGEMCYPPIDEIGPGMELAEGFHLRSGYRLPLESEWEQAVRAGSATERFYGRSAAPLERFAWFALNSHEQTHPVALLRPNPFGLFDVYGNVAEWTHAWPQQQLEGKAIARGGDYRSTPRFLESWVQTMYQPETRLSTLGFRIARTVK